MSDSSAPARPRRTWAVRVVVALLFVLGAYAVAIHLQENVHRIEAVQAAEGVTWTLDPDGVELVGAFHVHTERSHDAVGTREELSVAARTAGLDFVLVTDHMPRDDLPLPPELASMTVPVHPHPRAPDASAWVDGVLTVAGREMSLTRELGRALVFELDTLVNPWNGGREALLRQAHEHASTLFVTHPRSPRERDRWKGAPLDGFSGWEVFNLSDVARRRLASPSVLYHLAALGASALTGRSDRALAGLVPRPLGEPELLAYDSISAHGRFTALAAVNHHPRRRWGGTIVPGYLPFLRVFNNHVRLPEALPSDPSLAGARLLEAITRGEVHISLEDAPGARGFRMDVGDLLSGRPVGVMGGRVDHRAGLVLRAGLGDDPSAGRLLFRVLRDGRTAAWLDGTRVAHPLAEEGVYRVEVYRFRARFGQWTWGLRPWIVSNPIWVERTEGPGSRPRVAELAGIG